MLLSLLVYSLTGAILFFLGWHVNWREQRLQLHDCKQLPFYSWEIVISIMIFAVVAGARYHTGFDHAMYLEQYQHLQQTGEFTRTSFEYGFEWISKIFAHLHIHYFFYFAFWALLQIGLLYFGLRNHKFLLCWVGLGIMCCSYFLGWMNSVRQSVVVCLFVALIPLIRNRKFLPYAIIVFLAAFIHKSALLLLPVFFISFLKIEKRQLNRWCLLAIFALFVILGLRPFWIDWFTNYQWFLNLTGYSNYTNLSDPNVVGKFRTLNWGPSRITIFCNTLLMVLLYPDLKQYFKNDILLPYFFFLSFIGICLSNLLMNTSHFILRPVDYFTVFYLVIDAYMMVYLLSTKKYLFSILLFICIYTHTFIDVFKAIYRPIVVNQPFLYHTFLFPSM